MKYLLLIFALLLFGIIVNAQVKKVPKKLTAQPNWQITDRITGQRGYSKLKIITSVTDTEGKGQTLRFDANMDIAKVEIYFLENDNAINTMSYPDGIKNGYFYLESATYKGGLAKGYFLKFYVKGKAEHVWVSAIVPNK
jgi:hypothetical protein